MEKLKNSNKVMKKAIETLYEISMDKKEREIYEAIQKYEFNQNTRAYNMGVKEGQKKD